MANNVVFNSIRMNMNNPQHVKVNAVLSNLDNNVCKSKNQMIIDAIEFYIDHFGKEGKADQRRIAKGDIHNSAETQAVDLAHHVFHLTRDRL